VGRGRTLCMQDAHCDAAMLRPPIHASPRPSSSMSSHASYPSFPAWPEVPFSSSHSCAGVLLRPRRLNSKGPAWEGGKRPQSLSIHRNFGVPGYGRGSQGQLARPSWPMTREQAAICEANTRPHQPAHGWWLSKNERGLPTHAGSKQAVSVHAGPPPSGHPRPGATCRAALP